MTELQIVQLLGIVYAAMGIGLILSGPNYLKAVYANFAKQPGLMLFGGFLSVGIGYPMVVHYTTWDTLPGAIAAFFGWAALVKGVLLLAFPAAFEALSHMMIGKTGFIKVASGFVLALGVALGLVGFGVI
jgi:hypothetical protein